MSLSRAYFSRANRRGLLRKGAALSAVAAASAGLVAPARAQSSGDSLLNQVLARGTVLVGTGSTNPPWHFEDENGTLVGMDVEMGRILAQALFEDRNAVEFVVQAADARIPNLVSDKVDITIQFMSVTRDRAQLVAFTLPYYREAVTLMFPASSPYSTIAEVQGKGINISVLQNVYAEDLVHRGVPDAVVSQFDSNANTILAIDSGRADASLADYSTARWFAAQFPDKYKFAPDPWGTHSYAAAVKQGDPTWLGFVNTVFHSAMTGLDFDSYREPFERYFGDELVLPSAGFPTELS
ncbi:MAG: transporter substrate-binding domain-containing protein [Thermomicrobiales bacterium]|nr:transporter substrate-binding domain-containing protein [Thermomicrobiales bacterium]